MRLELPYPPTANLYWRIFRGHAVKSKDARQYQETAKLMAKAQALGAQPFKGDVRVEVHLRRPAKRGDLDNSLKVLLDALKGIAFEDDKQVVEIHAYRMDDKANPGVSVRIQES